MSNKITGWLGIIGGLVLVILSLVADLIRIGSYPGINYAQLIGIGVGLIVLVLGYVVLRREQKPQE